MWHHKSLPGLLCSPTVRAPAIKGKSKTYHRHLIIGVVSNFAN